MKRHVAELTEVTKRFNGQAAPEGVRQRAEFSGTESRPPLHSSAMRLIGLMSTASRPSARKKDAPCPKPTLFERERRRSDLQRILLGLCLLIAPSAPALPPLAVFLAGARQTSSDQRIAALTAVQQEADALVALGRVLPVLTARGVYTRNQYEAKIDASTFAGGMSPPGATTSLVVYPQNQLDAYLQLDVPVIDVAGWLRIDAAQHGARGAASNAQASVLEVERQAARNYSLLIGAAALHESAERTLAAAQANLALVIQRRTGGVATDLDVERAAAEVERAKRSISDAGLTQALARRALRTLTGVSADGPIEPVPDDLHPEVPLEQWEGGGVDGLPSVVAAREQRSQAESSALASSLVLVPTVSASAQEHFTNAPGFFGKNSVWIINATASWRLDVNTVGTMRSQRAAAQVARVREEAARRAAADQLHESWLRVRDGIARCRAARSEHQSAGAAVARARERYQVGTGTQLELLQAERDAFSAEVARIQADADLGYFRAVLRLAAGRPLDEEKSR